MSSPISQQLSEYGGALLAAVVDVAENSAFAVADPSDEATFEEAVSVVSGSDWVSSAIRFEGPVSGQLELTAPTVVVRRLCASFAGAVSADEIDEADVADFAGELTNMVCGTWLTRACRDQSFDLTPPRVIVGLSPEAASAKAQWRAAETLYLAIDDCPIRIQVVEEPSESHARRIVDGS